MTTRSILAVLLAGVLAASVPAPRAAAATPFGDLTQTYVNELEARDPLFADSIGIHTYDDRLPDFSRRGHLSDMTWYRAWRAKVSAALASGLSLNDEVDAHALIDTIDQTLFEDGALNPYAHDPTLYTAAIGNGVYNLTGRHYAPIEERMRHVAPRMRAVPALVAAAKANLTNATPAAAKYALHSIDGDIAMYAGLPAEAIGASPATRAAITRTLPATLASLRSLKAFLARLERHASLNPRVGAAIYDRDLLLANGTDASRAGLVARARADFAKNRAEMLRLAIPLDQKFFANDRAAESKPNAADVVVRRVLDKLAETNHPSADAIFSTAKADVAEAQAFIAEHPVLPLPTPSTLHVVPTPDFLAGFAGASLSAPGPFTPLAESYYYIDAIPKTWTKARVRSYLRDYNNYEMRILSMHEAMPGHYVQLRYNNEVPSLVRRVFSSGSFVEGWAVYIEGMMLDAGYGNADPALRLFQLKWRLREEANTIIDAGFHTEGMTEVQIKDLLGRGAYQETSEVLTKWNRLQLSHNQLSSYFVGLDAIRRAEAAERARLGTDFKVADFNGALLRMGSVEPRFIQKMMDQPSRTAP